MADPQQPNYFEDLAFAWATYRKNYGPTDAAAYKAFVAGWEAGHGLSDEGIPQ